MDSKRHAAKPGHVVLRSGRISLPGQIYSITAVTVDRRPYFRTFDVACAACRCFGAPGVLGDARLLAWVLMPDHVHWLIELGDDDLAGVVNRLKSASARASNRVLGRTGPLWARAFHDHAMRAEDNVRAVARYIVANPVRAGLTTRVGDHPFWNAIWL